MRGTFGGLAVLMKKAPHAQAATKLSWMATVRPILRFATTPAMAMHEHYALQLDDRVLGGSLLVCPLSPSVPLQSTPRHEP